MLDLTETDMYLPRILEAAHYLLDNNDRSDKATTTDPSGKKRIAPISSHSMDRSSQLDSSNLSHDECMSYYIPISQYTLLRGSAHNVFDN